MKNLVFPWSSWFSKQKTLIATALVLTLAAFVAGSTFFSGGTMRSVEFGLAEVSPLGEAGGYAIPASGESTGPFQASYICNAVGSNITLTVSFSYSTLETPRSTSIDINGTYYGTIFDSGYTQTQSGATYTVSRSFLFPASGTYTVLFTGQFGTGGTDNPLRHFSYTASVTPDCGVTGNGASVDLEVKNNTAGTDWEDGPINIDPNDNLDLRWTSRNVVTCDGHNFIATNRAVSGTQTDVNNPVAGASRTYTIICGSDGSGSVSDSVVVNATGGGPGTGGPPSLTGDPIYVFRGGDTDLTWDTNGNDPASCTLTGPGVNLSSLTSSTGTHTVVVYGESTYTLTCPGGTDSVTIRVLPVLQET